MINENLIKGQDCLTPKIYDFDINNIDPYKLNQNDEMNEYSMNEDECQDDEIEIEEIEDVVSFHSGNFNGGVIDNRHV